MWAWYVAHSSFYLTVQWLRMFPASRSALSGLQYYYSPVLYLPPFPCSLVSQSEESNNTWYHLLFHAATTNCHRYKYSKLKYTEILYIWRAVPINQKGSQSLCTVTSIDINVLKFNKVIKLTHLFKRTLKLCLKIRTITNLTSDS